MKVTKRSPVLDNFIPEGKLDDFLDDDLEQNEDSGKSEERYARLLIYYCMQITKNR